MLIIHFSLRTLSLVNIAAMNIGIEVSVVVSLIFFICKDMCMCFCVQYINMRDIEMKLLDYLVALCLTL